MIVGFLAQVKSIGPSRSRIGRVEPREIFGRNLGREREKLLPSQEALGDAADLHMTEVSPLERAVRDPRLSTITRLAKALGCLRPQLLDEIESAEGAV
jgi:transcriptional regulator with XRE-family HTH domain